MELDDYLDYLCGHLAENPRVFPLYGNDAEIFDFRPDRYHTEAVLQEESEWQRIGQLFEYLLTDNRFQFIRPAQVLGMIQLPGAGNRLYLEAAEQPIPVKKQGKYNLTRWAVTGRDNLGINTACWRIYETLKTKQSVNDNNYQKARPSGCEAFSDDRTVYGSAVSEQLTSYDVINLHWIAGFVDYRTFFAMIPQKMPVVWTLHDMNAFTGGCHYNDGCDRFTAQCGACHSSLCHYRAVAKSGKAGNDGHKLSTFCSGRICTRSPGTTLH